MWFEAVADDGVLCELLGAVGASAGHGIPAAWAGARLGVVANQPRSLAGTLDIQASQKGGSVRTPLRRVQPADPDAASTLRDSYPARTSSGGA